MSFIVPMEKPKRCGLCPCFHAEHPMHCQAVKACKDKRIIAPYGEPTPDWCPLIELPSAEPRKKGTYTESGENDEWYCWYATCNECGSEWMGSRNFCPNCGCQMNGGEEDG